MPRTVACRSFSRNATDLPLVGRPLISGTERKGRAGWRSRLPDRIWPRFHGFHLFVLKLPIDSTGRAVPTASDEDDTVGRIEIREISDAGDPDLDELVALDGMRKVFAVDAITDNHCYVARLEGKVIAATWSSRKTSCYVKELGREFAILADETYGWGTYCAPEYRGLNVVPRLVPTPTPIWHGGTARGLVWALSSPPTRGCFGRSESSEAARSVASVICRSARSVCTISSAAKPSVARPGGFSSSECGSEHAALRPRSSCSLQQEGLPCRTSRTGSRWKPRSRTRGSRPMPRCTVTRCATASILPARGRIRGV